MTMNRAEYESLASAIHEADLTQTDLDPKAILALEIATALCATNDRFDPLRFLQQCDLGLTTEDIGDYSHGLFLRTQTGVGEGRRFAAQRDR